MIKGWQVRSLPEDGLSPTRVNAGHVAGLVACQYEENAKVRVMTPPGLAKNQRHTTHAWSHRVPGPRLGRIQQAQRTGHTANLAHHDRRCSGDLKPPVSAKSTKKEEAEWTKLLERLDQLKAAPEAIPEPQVP